MGKAKVWERRWSDRKNKFYYVNTETRTSSWKQPEDFVEDTEKGKPTLKENQRDNAASATPSLTKRRHQSDSSDSQSPIHKSSKLDTTVEEQEEVVEESKEEEEEEMRAEDYTTVYSEKRQLVYYYNYKTKKSQWKKPSCLQEIETQKAVEKHRAEQTKPSPKPSPKASPKLCTRATPQKSKSGDCEAVFETPKSITAPKRITIKKRSKTLNVNARAFVPSGMIADKVENGGSSNGSHSTPLTPISPNTPLTSHTLKTPASPTTPLNLHTPKTPASPTTPLTPLSPVSPREKRRAVKSPITIKRSLVTAPLSPSTIRRQSEPIRKALADNFLKEDLRSRCTDVKKRLSDPIHKRIEPPKANVHDRLGTRRSCGNSISEEPWDFDISSNVRLKEADLLRLRSQMWLPPLPTVEVFRFSEVQQLRDLFVELCKDRLKLAEPTEAFNRWLLEQQLSKVQQNDPLLCYSDKRSESLFREIMQDVPKKIIIPRSMRHCSISLNTFVQCLQEIVDEHAECEDERTKLSDILTTALMNNDKAADTREQISSLRDACQPLLDRVYSPIVGGVCDEMTNATRAAAQRVYDMSSKVLVNEIRDRPDVELSTSTNLVYCKPAVMLTPAPDHIMSIVNSSREGIKIKLVCQDELMYINTSHMKKLRRLYEMSCTDDEVSEKLEIRVWCLLKRYDMLRSSMSTGHSKLSENFGLHAALPTKAFRLLAEEFHVTFECFASPLNCYYNQYCSAFPDIDCYFGSRGSFFDFRPKSGAFQANPPFSEEVMSAMADHMIDLLTETDEPLMFIIFIPDWRDPVTPALIKLEDSLYCRTSRLIEKGKHQYITGRQHIHSRDSMFYDAVHGTMVFVLQNNAAASKWQVDEALMNRLNQAMCSSRN